MDNMSPVIWFIASVLPYVTAIVFIMGIIYRIIVWIRIPLPFRYTLFPAAQTTGGVVTSLLGDIISLRRLYKTDKPLWIGAILFHIGLVLSISLHVRHLIAPPEFWTALGLTEDLIFVLGSIGGVLVAVSLPYFLIRRMVITKVKVLSTFEDYFVLVFTLIVVLFGTYMRLLRLIDPNELGAYAAGLVTLNPVAPPDHPLFFIKLLIGQIYLMYLPFSKMTMHAIGAWFNLPIVKSR